HTFGSSALGFSVPRAIAIVRAFIFSYEVIPIFRLFMGLLLSRGAPRQPFSGVVLADHLKSADWAARRAEFVAKVSADVLAEVTAKLRPLLGLSGCIGSTDAADL